jgi:hypothetical protein
MCIRDRLTPQGGAGGSLIGGVSANMLLIGAGVLAVGALLYFRKG